MPLLPVVPLWPTYVPGARKRKPPLPPPPPPPLMAVPNGGSRKNAWEGARLKQIGVRAGAFDLVCLSMAPRNDRPTGVEMKRAKGGKLSDQQKAFHSLAVQKGWNVVVGAGAADAIAKLQELGY